MDLKKVNEQLNKLQSVLKEDVVHDYVEKYKMKMNGSSLETALGWIDGSNASDEDKGKIFLGIWDKIVYMKADKSRNFAKDYRWFILPWNMVRGKVKWNDLIESSLKLQDVLAPAITYQQLIDKIYAITDNSGEINNADIMKATAQLIAEYNKNVNASIRKNLNQIIDAITAIEIGRTPGGH